MRGRKAFPGTMPNCIVEVFHEDQVLRSEPMSYNKAIKAAAKFTAKGIKARVRERPGDGPV